MSIPYSYGTSFDTPTCIQGWVEYPFARFGNNTTKLYHHIMVQNGDVYTPLTYNSEMTAADEKPDRSPFADDSSAYWVEDRGQAPSGDNLITFDRIFSNIPLDYTEGGGLYSFTFPTTTASNLTVNIANAGAVASGDTWELTFSLLNADSVNFNVGDAVVVRGSGNFTPVGGSSTARSYWKWIITEKNGLNSGVSPAPGSGWVSYAAILEGGEGVSSLSEPLSSPLPMDKVGTFSRGSPITLNSESILTYRFVKTSDIKGEGLADRFQIYAYGATNYTLTDTVGVTTLPDAAIYQGMSKVITYIQAEPETPVRWMGNIWQIVGRKVRAR
jgi:hypothetical protein